MRIAVMADIHGNLPAFEAAIAHYQTTGADLLLLAGDVVNGAPDSALCWELAESLGSPIIRGNHERYVGLYGTAGAPAEWSTDRFSPVRWSSAQFTKAKKEGLAALPLEWRSADVPDIFFCHSSVRSDSDAVAPYTLETELEAMFSGITAPLIVRAHNHAPAVRLWRRGSIITTGSIGLTLDGIPSAQYLLLTRVADSWRIEHQLVEYDIETALSRFHETGYLKYGGPMARLFYREVATAAFHVVPFMRAYSRWSTQEPIGLDEAIDRFLAL